MSEEMADAEAATTRWRAAFNDPEFLDALLLGMPKRPDGWWQS